MTATPLVLPCPDCRTSTSYACSACGQYGARRAQLVLTVANLDTGAVASAEVVPGMLEPRPAPGGGWHLALTPLLHDLAASVGAGSIHHVTAPTEPVGERLVPLPAWWRPDLPAEQRHDVEAAAIAGWTRTPWQVFLGRTAARPAPDPDRQLARLCAVAGLLCLDLVVEARRLPGAAESFGWEVRYELPGSVPPEQSAAFPDLRTAVAATTVERAVALLAARRVAAPAHFVRSAGPAGVARPVTLDVISGIDLDQVERRTLGGCVAPATGEERPGAQAIWRNGGWWYTGLRPGGVPERHTGQFRSRPTSMLRRNWEPPAPHWRGAPIPYVDCADCDPTTGLRPCDCTLGGQSAEPECARCRGAGRCASVLPCHACGDTRRRYLGTIVTLSNLRDRVLHLNWEVGPPPPALLVGSQPNGQPVIQLPGRYRLARWAGAFRVRPDDLADLDGGGGVDQDLRDGIVTLPDPDADPLAHYVGYASRGQPGARLFVRAGRPDVPPLADLIRLALGLGLVATVTVQNHRLDESDPLRLHGEGWHVELNAPALPVGVPELPTHPTVETAIADCLDCLDLALAEVVPADPRYPIPVPSSPEPALLDDPLPPLTHLGARYAGQPVTVRFDPAGCHLYLRVNHSARHIATAATITALHAILEAPGVSFPN
ncbi:hypothetical protein GCM10022225_30920 [Plantactinospora mayteni]|uniref:Uncharacterized protein n=1 Tax=Plantactinospora mayteni TaxID=566021 RepID=A0ABQ4F3K5_9ACTN|nr:hypothetical protein [Plantactinospora mayteni]GIH01501.1 hypothetical protein Pma05_80730 [Plantactinospora mayteni]